MWRQTWVFVPWAGAVMEAGVLFLAPREAGGLVDTYSQQGSWLGRESQANSHKEQQGGKSLDRISTFQTLCHPWKTKLTINDLKFQNKHFHLVFQI